MKNSLLKIIAVICIVMCFTGAVSGIGETVTDNETTTQAEKTTQTAEETTQKAEEPVTDSKPALSMPVISSVKATTEGVEIRWKKVSGADFYRIYRKISGSDRIEIGTTKETVFVDKKATSGKKISYYVRGVDSVNNIMSPYSSSESISFVKAPVINKFSNTATGTKITWSKSEGASKYRIFCLDSKGNWKKLATVKATGYTHDKLKSGTTYTYTVRCLDPDDKYVSAYYTEGFKNTYFSSPSVSALQNINGGVKISWKKKSGVASYKVYRKTAESGWKEIGKTKSGSFTDKKVGNGKKYTYSVRCLDSAGKTVSAMNSGKSITYIKPPVIKRFTNTATGTKITWSKREGVAKYRIYCLDSKGNWKKLATVKATSYTHNKLKSGVTYTYTVRCLSSDDKFISAHDSDGFKNTYIASPAVSSLQNVSGGVKISWKKKSGVTSYKVYRKTSKSEWKEIGKTKGGSYTDKKVESGQRYAYSVRCLDSSGKAVSALTAGKSITYVKAPEIISFVPTATGVKITWVKCSGAKQYRIYSVGSKGELKSLGVVKSTSYTHDKLKSGDKYSYVVVCLDSDGKVISGSSAKKSFRFIAPPSIPSISKDKNGILIKWAAIKNVNGYRLFRKPFGGRYEFLADVVKGNSFVDTTTKAKTAYTYCIRCLDSKGNYMSYFRVDPRYYYDGKPAQGAFSVNGKVYYLSAGVLSGGLQNINGNYYYFDTKGNLRKNGIVGSNNEGWYYADQTGKINFNYVNGVLHNGESWIVSNGKAKKATTKSDIVLFRAAKEVAKATDTSMTKAQKLKACFDYCKKAYKEYNPRIPHYTGMDWPIVYANDMFVGGGGNCFSYGAAFAYMAKAIGYTEVYCCNSGGHGWAEIDDKIYDPEWSRHHSNYTYFGLDYNKIKNPNYKGAIAAGYPWMHIKI